jgi:hypothetical protein
MNQETKINNLKPGYELTVSRYMCRPWLAQKYEKFYMNNLKNLFGEPNLEYFDNNVSNNFNIFNLVLIILILFLTYTLFI